MKFNKVVSSLVAVYSLVSTAVYADEPFEDVAYEMFKDSIAMRTVAGEGNETPKYAKYLEDRLKSAGFTDEDIIILPHEDTVAMIVYYRGNGRAGKNPVVLSAHLDVVEALPEDWIRNPFELIEEDGMFFGRGVFDTKLSVSLLVANFMRMKSEGFVPSRDLILAFSGDEETGMATTQIMTKMFKENDDPDFAIIADGGGGSLDPENNPFAFRVDHAEKAYADFEVTARNPGGHSSMPRKDNAIYELARATVKLSEYEFPVIQSPLTQAFFEKMAPLESNPEISAAMKAFAHDKYNMYAVDVLRSYPQYAGMTGTTCVATMGEAGHAANALPQTAKMTINCRIFPGEGIAKTLSQLKEALDNENLEWDYIDDDDESGESPLKDEVLNAVEKAVQAEHSTVPIVPSMAMFGTDAQHFRRANIPAYALMGNFLKDTDDFSHGLNERNPISNLSFGMRFWYQVMTEWAGD